MTSTAVNNSTQQHNATQQRRAVVRLSSAPQSSGTTYLLVATLVDAAATLCLRDRRGTPLGPEHEAEQANGDTVFRSKSLRREITANC